MKRAKKETMLIFSKERAKKSVPQARRIYNINRIILSWFTVLLSLLSPAF